MVASLLNAITIIAVAAGLVWTLELAEACGLYLKMHITATRTIGIGANCDFSQMSELYVYENGVQAQIQSIEAFIGDSSTPAPSPQNEGVSNLIDGIQTTKFLTSLTDHTIHMVFTQPRCINSYEYRTANDADCRDPITWTIADSLDGSNYIVRHSIVGGSIPTLREALISRFSFSNTWSPTSAPSSAPSTSSPSVSPITSLPSTSPITSTPSSSPSTSSPTLSPSFVPTISPTTSVPSASPTTSSPTSAPTTPNPTVSPSAEPSISPTTSVPTKSPTLRAPQIINASLSSTLLTVEIDFDIPTNYGIFQTKRVCQPGVSIGDDDTGCDDGSPCPTLCHFSSPTKLIIELNPLSNFKNVTTVVVSSLAEVAQLNHNPELGFDVVHTSVSVHPPGNPVTPSVTITGPSLISLCSSVIPMFRSVSTGGGGRPLDLQWFENGEKVQNATTNTFFIKLPEAPALITYEVQATNWYGSRENATLIANFTSAATCSVSLNVPIDLNPRTISGATIEASVLLSTACLPAGYNVSDVKLTYDWAIENIATSTPLNLSQIDPMGSRTSKLRISPLSYLTPGQSFVVTVNVATGIPGLSGSATATVLVPKANAIARIANASIVTTDSIAQLNAAVSCDPNLPKPICNELIGGQADLNVTGIKSFTWYCHTSNGSPCFGSEAAEITYCANLAVCAVNVTAIPDVETNGPFQVYVVVQTFSSDEESASASITLLYQPQEACPYPTLSVSCACKPRQIINVDDDLKLSVTSTMPSTWTLAPPNQTRMQVIQWSYALDNGTYLKIGNDQLLPGQVLILGPRLQGGFPRIEGKRYTFRATSVQRCDQLLQGSTLFSTAFSEISFTVNGPPVGGSLIISPSSGNISTDFTFTCSGFVDPDLPLQYSFAYLRGALWQTLGQGFSDISQIASKLSVNDTGHTVICRARDSFQAVSKLDLAPTVTGIIVEVPSSEEVLESAQHLGANLANALASGVTPNQLMGLIALAAGNVKQILFANASQEEKDNVRALLLNGLGLLMDAQSTASTPTGAESEQVIHVLSSIVGDDPVNASDTNGVQLLNLAANVLGTALESVKYSQSTGLNEGVGKASSIDIATSTSGLVSNIFSSLSTSVPALPSSDATKAPTAPRANGRRRLQASDSHQEAIIHSTRKALRDLADVLLAEYLEGETPFVLPAGVDIKLVGVVATPATIGEESSLQQLAIPAFNESDPPSVFFFPRNVLSGSTNDSHSRVNIVAARFRFNVREIIRSGLVNFTLDQLAPISRVEEVLALDFQRPTETAPYHPSNLQEPIRIKMPLSFDELPTVNETRLACGFWDENISGWSSFGCNVTEYNLPTSLSDNSGWIMCSCNHASDYAAWKAFVEDITAVFANPLDLNSLTTIAAVVCGVLLPTIVIFWLLAARLGRKRDLVDSRRVHLGTFVTITRRKLQLHDRQRRFFKILRENRGLSAKQLVQVQHQAEEEERRRHSELVSREETEPEGTTFYLKTVILHVLRSMALTNALAASMFIVGTVAGSFHASSDLSLTALVASDDTSNRPLFRTTQALIGVSVFLCFVGAAVCLVLLNKQGRVTQEFKLLFAISTMACAIGTAAFALPVAHIASFGGTSGASGLGLIIAAGSLCIVNFLASGLIWFIRAHQMDSRSIIVEFLANCGRGLLYEQSIISIFTKFDPYLDREKRFSLFVAILIGNLFAASFFFSLKTANEVSLGFMIGTVILSAFVVAVPVKLTIKFLFKITAARKGSAMDRVAQIFRIVAFSNDIHPAFANEAQRLDIELLHTFKRFYMSKHQVFLLEDAFENQQKMDDDLNHLARGLPPKGTYEYYLPILLNVDSVCQLSAAILLIAGFSIDEFASISSMQDPQRPDASSIAVGAIAIILALLVVLIQVYLVLLGKTTAPKLFKLLLTLHVLLIIFSVAAMAVPLGTVSVLFVGLDLVITASSVSLAGQMAFAAVLFIYYYCAPSIQSIHRFHRDGGAAVVSVFKNQVDTKDEEALPQRPVSATLGKHQRAAASSGAGSVVDTPGDLGSFNPIARKEVSDAMRSSYLDTTDRRTGEFDVGWNQREVTSGSQDDDKDEARPRTDTLSRAKSARLDSKRFVSNTEKLGKITKHDFVEQALQKSVGGKITPDMIHLARAHLDQTKKELKKVSELSRLAWLKQNPLSLSAKQMVVRRERTVMLKLAALLSEEASPRPRHIKRWLPNKVMMLSWTVLILYYIGGLIWIAFWIFSRDGESKQRLIETGVENPTREQIAETTNVVLVSWLGGSFFAMFISYFIAEPALIILRYGIIPLVLRLMPRRQELLKEAALPVMGPIEHQEQPPQGARTRCFGVCCCRSRRRNNNTPGSQERDAAFVGASFDALTDFIEAVA